MAKAKDSWDLFNDETKALRELNTAYQRLSMTAPVDDDFPEMKFNYDNAVRGFVDAANAYRSNVLSTTPTAGAAMDSLARIREINVMRCNRWHSEGIGSWSLSDWAVALAGECGEVCDVVKKLNRARDGLVGNKCSPAELQMDLADEVADTFIYLDLFAKAAGIDLYTAIRNKFNAVSIRLNLPERL